MTGRHLDLATYQGQEEGQYFERKSLWHGPEGRKVPRERKEVRDQIAEYAAAFVNADGGVLILGMEDDGTFTGHGYPADAVEEMLKVPARRLVPPQAEGWRQRVGEVEVLVFSWGPAPRAVRVEGDGYPRRVDDLVIQDSEEAINAVKRQGQIESAEVDLLPEARLEDLDPDLLRRAALAAGLDAGDPQAYLVERRLAERRGADLVLRRAALLLFAKSAALQQHPNAGFRVFRVEGRERQSGPHSNVEEIKPRLEGALPVVLERAYERMGQLIGFSEKLHDLFFREMPKYPTFAWQEALVNAAGHRDYRQQARGTEVWLYQDRLEVISPGALLPSLTIDDLQKRREVHASRNPRMARVLAELGLMRERGEGVPRIHEEMEQSWLPLPEFKEENGLFTVTLRNTPIFETGRPEWAAFVRQLAIGTRQKRILVKNEGGSFRSGEYQTLNQVDRDQAYRELRELVEAGYLEGPDHPGAGAIYRVRLTLPEAGGPPPQPQGPAAALRERMDTKGFIKNLDYQAVYEVSRQHATRALAQLVQDGVLRRDEGGKRYFPGPRWGEFDLPAQ